MTCWQLVAASRLMIWSRKGQATNPLDCAQGLSITNVVGRLISVGNDVSKSLNLTYNSLGQITARRQVTNGVNYDFTYDYYLPGTLKSIGYPQSTRTVTYGIDNAGRVNSASGVTTSPSSSASYASIPAAGGFAPHGRFRR
jgi:hypothetical protein